MKSCVGVGDSWRKRAKIGNVKVEWPEDLVFYVDSM